MSRGETSEPRHSSHNDRAANERPRTVGSDLRGPTPLDPQDPRPHHRGGRRDRHPARLSAGSDRGRDAVVHRAGDGGSRRADRRRDRRRRLRRRSGAPRTGRPARLLHADRERVGSGRRRRHAVSDLGEHRRRRQGQRHTADSCRRAERGCSSTRSSRGRRGPSRPQRTSTPAPTSPSTGTHCSRPASRSRPSSRSPPTSPRRTWTSRSR